MWGYIGVWVKNKKRRAVPSLYVRVYRIKTFCEAIGISSLIICEGISPVRTSRASHNGFPHYMWGYIANFQPDGKTGSVPSLYVRVYRCSVSVITPRQRSLIICEGISVTPPSDSRCQAFPHYMWVYIEIGNGILQASKNINVVDDSIPQIA